MTRVDRSNTNNLYGNSIALYSQQPERREDYHNVEWVHSAYGKLFPLRVRLELRIAKSICWSIHD